MLVTAGAMQWTSSNSPIHPPDSSGIHPRSAWAKSSNVDTMARMWSVDRITIHHEGSVPFESNDRRAVARRIEGIRRHHRQELGWADIGYHYVLDRLGEVWEARSLEHQGAHAGTLALNEGNLGVVILGNYNDQPLNSSQKEGLEDALETWMNRFGVEVDDVQLHGDLKQTDCPGTAVRDWFVDWQTRYEAD